VINFQQNIPSANSGCASNYYRDAVTRKCVDCGDEQNNSGPIFVVIILVIVNLMIYIPKMTGPVKKLYLKYQHVVNYGAILLITWQSELRVCIVVARYPLLFTHASLLTPWPSPPFF
jgi:hypothetical protein